ncbi:hypothetical protein SADUNF_Sadunf14G0089500 [Salix dunnii]|uniref:CP12 domain-containing protein n=1 Tax=Salix dunnii TaxID=1413687 RepID=A0A835MJW7_9ROSI|nr:hypothetical protein SADUNF_Sadunf14G0089500 [Salix dunnii]
MATTAGPKLSTPGVIAKSTDTPKAQPLFKLTQPWRRSYQPGSWRMQIRPVRAAPERISEKVEKSIKEEEVCSGDAASGECAAAWDEVEELSAAASHAKAKKKESDPLEEHCKDNPETDECRTYEDGNARAYPTPS